MIREIKVFDGGINNLIAGHLIGSNQSVYAANANIRSGAIESNRQSKITAEVVLGKSTTYYEAVNQVVSSAEDRFYVEWAGMLYWSNSAGTMKRYDGTTVNNIGGHTAPTVNPTIAASVTAGIPDGDYWYTYTYIHSDLFESAPSGFVMVSVVNKQITVTFTDTPPTTVTHRKLYRAGGINPTFNHLVTIAKATTSYTDNISDFSISREELSTYNNTPPPSGLDMLIETQGVFFGVLGNKVYFSRPGQPEHWSTYGYVQLPKTITGLGAIGGSVVAFTNDSMYMLQGSSINDIMVSKLPYSYGCKNKLTVKNIEGRLVWVSSLDDSDVICVFDGSSVQIANRTALHFNAATIGEMAYSDFDAETWANFSFDIQNAHVSHLKYYLFLSGRTVILDFEGNMRVTYNIEDVDAAYNKNGQMFTINGTAVYEYMPDLSTYRSIVYRTGDFDDGEITRKKNYRAIKVSGTGNYKVSVHVDEIWIMDITTDKEFMPYDVYGNIISFTISSTGYANVKAIAYEFDLLKE